MCTNAGDVVNNVRVDVPFETWKGEGALITCTLPVFSDNGWNLKWSKGSDGVYLYKRSSNSGRAYKDLADRCVGRLDGNVHKLYINSTTVGDEATYKCEVDTQQDSKKLIVNCEYSKYIKNVQ